MAAHILVIEDSVETARLLGSALRRDDDTIEVVAVSSSVAGLEHIGRAQVDCVLLDYRLQDGNGVDCLRRIRERWPAIPVIMITGEGSEDVAVEAMKLGAFDYVVKHGHYLRKVVEVVREAVAKEKVRRTRARLAHGVFVGREVELGSLRACIDDALTGHGRILLLEGEAGIGKSTLARQVVAHALSRGLSVHWKRCHETGGAPPYWPWIQLLRDCVQSSPADDLQEDLGPAASAIAQLVGEIAQRLPGLGAASDLEPEQARFRLFDGITLYLKKAARRRPVLIVLDDLQWADRSSLLLLQFLARELGNAALAVLCLYRPIEMAADGAATAAMTALRREGEALHLGGLTESEVRDLVTEVSDQKVPATFTRALFERTAGHPFFLVEILRHLNEEGILYHDGGRWTMRVSPQEMRIPEGVREVIGRRLDRISAGCRELLSVASVLHPEFGVATLAEVSGTGAEQVCAALDEALAAQVVDRVPGPVGDFRFGNELTREVLYESLATLRRAELHRLVGESMERRHAPEIDLCAAQLAYHFLRATPPQGVAKAVGYAIRAAAHAGALMAHEEAARQYEIGLRALEATHSGGSPRRLELLLQASEAWWRAGETERARQAALQGVEIARATAAPTELARAALAYGGRSPGLGAVVCDQMVVQLLEEASTRLGDEEKALRARVMGRLAEEMTFSNERSRRRQLAREAVETARQLRDPMTLAAVLKNMHWALWTPEEVENRLALADEVVSLADAAGDQAMSFDGHLFRCFAKLELADMAAVSEEYAALTTLTSGLHQPYYSWLAASTRVCLAFTRGLLDRIEPLAQQSLDLGRRAQNANALLFYGAQMAHLLWLRGRFAEVEVFWDAMRNEYPLLGASLQCALAITLAEQGKEDEARAVFESVAVDEFKGIPRDVIWSQNICFLSETCTFLGDAERAAILYRMLKPFEGRIVMLTPAAPWGAAGQYLGGLATVMGEREAARRHFEDAIATLSRAGMRQWLARAQLAYAKLLSEDDNPSDGERALALLEKSAETCRSLDMPVLAEKVEAVRAQVSRRHVAATATCGNGDNGRREHHGETNGTRQCVFRREGAYWTIEREGNVGRLPNLNGMLLIAYLVQRPGQKVYVLELRALIHPPVAPDSPWNPADVDELTHVRSETPLGPQLDRRAILDIHAHIRDLGPDIQEAELNHDLGRAEKLREEREQCLEELTRARGKGGRLRGKATEEERARTAVQKAIMKTAVPRIEQLDPIIGNHLALHIKTGTYCHYEPDRVHPITWIF